MNRTETYQDYLQLVVTDLNGRGVGYSEVSEHYSFRSAYDDGLSAADAVTDCLEWLES